MRDARNWPDIMVIDGRLCRRCVQTGQYDVLEFVRSLQEVRPGAGYSLFYSDEACEAWHPRGPTYCWHNDGTIGERYWKTVRGADSETHDYQYYPTGELFRFTHSRRRDPRIEPRGAYDLTEEVFARDGTLLGFVQSSGGGGRTSKALAYWVGEKVPFETFERRASFAQERALRRMQGPSLSR